MQCNGSHTAIGGSGAARGLRDALASCQFASILGVYDGLSTLVACQTDCDALWASGLGISASQGRPDASVLTMTEVREAATVIARASTKPVICDCETGFGEVRMLQRVVAEFESAAVAGICIEDKREPKRNSFLPGHRLADPYEFAAKIFTAKQSQANPDFIVAARLESLIAGAGMDDALERGTIYSQAGADALVVHSKAEAPSEILAFAAAWREMSRETPLVVIPTTYYRVHRDQLATAGIAAAIYANQALRAATRAMRSVLQDIVRLGTTAPLEQGLASVEDLFDLTREDDVQELDRRFTETAEQLRLGAHTLDVRTRA